MNQQEAVVQTIERLGGMATLGQLYEEVFKIRECKWGTKTPLASIRRIVQLHPAIYKIRPGLYGLVSKKKEHEARGIVETERNKTAAETLEFGHTYYQALLLKIAALRRLDCWCPDQDKNKPALNTTLGALRTLQELPGFSYDWLVKRASTVDVVWFNERKMPGSFFEIEHGTDMHNSLVKLTELQDFHARMVIVSHKRRQSEFATKKKLTAFRDIADRTDFLSFDALAREYEHEVQASRSGFKL